MSFGAQPAPPRKLLSLPKSSNRSTNNHNLLSRGRREGRHNFSSLLHQHFLLVTSVIFFFVDSWLHLLSYALAKNEVSMLCHRGQSRETDERGTERSVDGCREPSRKLAQTFDLLSLSAKLAGHSQPASEMSVFPPTCFAELHNRTILRMGCDNDRCWAMGRKLNY